MSITSIGIMFGIFLVGWLIGFFDSNLRTSKKIKAAEQKSEIAVREAEEKIAHAEQKLALVMRTAQDQDTPKDDPGLLRLKNNGGRFVIEMDGMPVGGPLPPERKKRLIELLTILRPLLEGGAPPRSVPQPAAPVQTPPPAPVPVQPAVSRPVEPAAPAGKKAEPEKNIKALSIVGQIDAVLQARLADTPLAKRGIRLQESSQGGVEVYVGLEKFPSIDDVTDETIKASIRAAIAEWESKYVPGM